VSPEGGGLQIRRELEAPVGLPMLPLDLESSGLLADKTTEKDN
jgi:hypothetical protein